MYNRSLLVCQLSSMSFYIVSPSAWQVRSGRLSYVPFLIRPVQAIATTTYYYAGQYIASPAFVSPPRSALIHRSKLTRMSVVHAVQGSAGVLIKRIAYGLALPALFVSCTIYTHVPAKWIFVNILKGSEHLTKNTFKHWVVWFGCVLGCVLFSYVVAS